MFVILLTLVMVFLLTRCITKQVIKRCWYLLSVFHKCPTRLRRSLNPRLPYVFRNHFPQTTYSRYVSSCVVCPLLTVFLLCRPHREQGIQRVDLTSTYLYRPTNLRNKIREVEVLRFSSSSLTNPTPFLSSLPFPPLYVNPVPLRQ